MIGFIQWYYGESVPGIFRFWRNFVRVTLRFFAISWHVTNFFRPWKQMALGYDEHGFNIKVFISSLNYNVVSRLIGMVIRTVLIVWGVISVLFLAIVGAVITIVWALLPIGLLIFTVYAVWEVVNPLL